jgi:hypothetical protein
VVVARRRSGPAAVRVRLRSVRRWTAPRDRRGRVGRSGGASAGRRRDLVRRVGPERRPCADDSDRRRLLGHAAPARRPRRVSRRRGRGGWARRHRRRERRCRDARLARPPRRAADRRRGRVPRPAALPPCARTAACRRAARSGGAALTCSGPRSRAASVRAGARRRARSGGCAASAGAGRRAAARRGAAGAGCARAGRCARGRGGCRRAASRGARRRLLAAFHRDDDPGRHAPRCGRSSEGCRADAAIDRPGRPSACARDRDARSRPDARDGAARAGPAPRVGCSTCAARVDCSGSCPDRAAGGRGPAPVRSVTRAASSRADHARRGRGRVALDPARARVRPRGAAGEAKGTTYHCRR